MKIPKKISPDRIKDAIVEIKYSTGIPFEVAIGYFYKSLDDTYIYTNRPIGKQQIQQSSLSSPLSELSISFGGQSLFFNDKIKIQLQPNSIIFSCLNDYPSWDIYRAEIDKVLKQFKEAKVIDKYIRIGVRYISEYPEIDLTDCVKFNFTFGMPEVKSDTYIFRSEFTWDGYRIILNLSNVIPVLKAQQNTNQVVIQKQSVVDIDSIKDKIDIANDDLDNLINNIDLVHQKQKEVFFNLLKEDFLKKLNPVY